MNTVIFDMDGLLIDSEPLWYDAMNEVLSGLGIWLSAEEALKTKGLRTVEVVSYWHRIHQWTGKTNEEVVREIIQTVTRMIVTEGRKMKGVNYILDLFKTKKFKLGLASSSPYSLIHAALDHFELKSYFDVIYSAENERFGKPHPAVYLACLERLNSDPLESLAFEDSVNGMVAAKAARIKTVVVPEKPHFDDPRYGLADKKLGSLLEFTESFLREL